ncbi:MAG: AzlD domain-containing protein [Burkholderiales bacterium]|nr:MAG: AzlD domain-containing protein [Burkholderiales bacterium]
MSYSSTQIWIAIVLLTVIVTAARSTFLLLPRSLRPRGLLARALDFAPVAALAGIVAPDVLAPLGAAEAGLLALAADARLPAAVALVAVASYTRNAFAGLGCGLVLYFALRALVA